MKYEIVVRFSLTYPKIKEFLVLINMLYIINKLHFQSFIIIQKPLHIFKCEFTSFFANDTYLTYIGVLFFVQNHPGNAPNRIDSQMQQ